jgi:hypothetical protein
MLGAAVGASVGLEVGTAVRAVGAVGAEVAIGWGAAAGTHALNRTTIKVVIVNSLRDIVS